MLWVAREVKLAHYRDPRLPSRNQILAIDCDRTSISGMITAKQGWNRHGRVIGSRCVQNQAIGRWLRAQAASKDEQK